MCQNLLETLPGKGMLLLNAVIFLVKATPKSSAYSGYVRIIGKNELLNTKNKEKPLNLLKLIMQLAATH